MSEGKSTYSFIKKRIKKTIISAYKNGMNPFESLIKEKKTCMKVMQIDDEQWDKESVRAVKAFHEKMKIQDKQLSNQTKFYLS
ncbi:MAG: hypothetical protein QNJ31_01555 [Candidatus Caenarcaniphilales bacterium]|nr:hypothetical protein [Candidatus Caenarcaniphilales bacterium]